MGSCGTDECPDEIRYARHGHEFHGVKMNGMKNSENLKEDDILERNKNLNRGFRKLRVWREAIDLYVFEKKVLGQIKGISFKIKDQILASGFSISSNLAALFK
jgi:hypothetical protein